MRILPVYFLGAFLAYIVTGTPLTGSNNKQKQRTFKYTLDDLEFLQLTDTDKFILLKKEILLDLIIRGQVDQYDQRIKRELRKLEKLEREEERKNHRLFYLLDEKDDVIGMGGEVVEFQNQLLQNPEYTVVEVVEVEEEEVSEENTKKEKVKGKVEAGLMPVLLMGWDRKERGNG